MWRHSTLSMHTTIFSVHKIISFFLLRWNAVGSIEMILFFCCALPFLRSFKLHQNANDDPIIVGNYFCQTSLPGKEKKNGFLFLHKNKFLSAMTALFNFRFHFDECLNKFYLKIINECLDHCSSWYWLWLYYLVYLGSVFI